MVFPKRVFSKRFVVDCLSGKKIERLRVLFLQFTSCIKSIYQRVGAAACLGLFDAVEQLKLREQLSQNLLLISLWKTNFTMQRQQQQQQQQQQSSFVY